MLFFRCCESPTGKKDGVHGSPHHSSETSPEMLEWINDDFSDGDKLLDVIHKFKPTVRKMFTIVCFHFVALRAGIGHRGFYLCEVLFMALC